MRYIPLLYILLVYSVATAQTGNCGIAYGKTELQTNYLSKTIHTTGELWTDDNGNGRYEIRFPDTTLQFFQRSAVWMSGKDQSGQWRVAANTWKMNGSDFYPGPLDSMGMTHAGRCFDWDFTTSVSREAITQHRQLTQQYVTGNGAGIPIQQLDPGILYWPAAGNPYFRGQSGTIYQLSLQKEMAPYVEVDGQPGYNPVYGDYPDVPGDENVWWVFNDVGNEHFNSGGEPLGVEVHGLAYAYNQPSALQYSTFYRYKVTSHRHDLDSFRFSQWLSPGDLSLKDFFGTDTVSQVTFWAVSWPDDTTVLVGLQWLDAQLQDQPQQSIRLSNAMFFNNDYSLGGIPQEPKHYRYYQASRWKDGSHFTYGFAGNQRAYIMFPDDPADSTGWSACDLGYTPFDRNLITGLTPVTLRKGSTMEINFAVWNTRCPTNTPTGCPGFDCFRPLAQEHQRFYNQQVTSVQPANTMQRVMIFPNPASQSLTIELPSPMQSAQIQVFNAMGQEVRQFTQTTTRQQLQVSDLPNGWYVISYKSNDYSFGRQKLLIQR